MDIKLPTPIYKGGFSLDEAIYKRSSRRNFLSKKLSQVQVSQLLWVAQGLTKGHSRSVPSSGATYPLEVFVVIGSDCVEGIEEGVYWYMYNNHSISLHREGDWRKELAMASFGQDFIFYAPIDIVITAEFERTTTRYGRRGERYVYMEVGHAGQNVYLTAESLGLGTVAIGAFSDEDVKNVLALPKRLVPLYIMPVGYAK